jgi:hypothetical protein
METIKNEQLESGTIVKIIFSSQQIPLHELQQCSAKLRAAIQDAAARSYSCVSWLPSR